MWVCGCGCLGEVGYDSKTKKDMFSDVIICNMIFIFIFIFNPVCLVIVTNLNAFNVAISFTCCF